MESKLENSDLVRLTEEFLSKQDTGVGVGNFCNILYGKKIVPKKVKTIRKKYAPFDIQTELPILIVDDTVFGSASRGFLLTNSVLYYHLYPIKNGLPIKGSIKLSDILIIKLEPTKRSSMLIINGERVGYVTGFSLKWPDILEANVLNELFMLYMEYLGTQGDGCMSSKGWHVQKETVLPGKETETL